MWKCFLGSWFTSKNYLWCFPGLPHKKSEYDFSSFAGTNMSVDTIIHCTTRWKGADFWNGLLNMVISSKGLENIFKSYCAVLLFCDAALGEVLLSMLENRKTEQLFKESFWSSVHITSPVTPRLDVHFPPTHMFAHCKHLPQTQYDFSSYSTTQNCQMFLALRLMVGFLFNSQQTN